MKVKKTDEDEENLWKWRKLMKDKKTKEGKEMKVKKSYESEENLWKWR